MGAFSIQPTAEYNALQAQRKRDYAVLEELKPRITTLNHVKFNFDILLRDTLPEGLDLQFVMFLEGCDQPKMVALPFGEGSLLDAMNRVDQVDDLFMGKRDNRYIGSREEYRKTFSSMLQLLLYLCSEEPDMPQIEHPQKRRTFSGGVRSPKEPQVWDVGVRVSNAIRNYKNHERSAEKEMPSVQGAHSSPRPHVRAAHWHTFWVGPRSAKFPDRKPIIRWLPPIPIRIDWKRELPTNIHMVLES
jgi:hypothetical protein